MRNGGHFVSALTCCQIMARHGNDFPHHWPIVRGFHRSPVDSPNKGSVITEPCELISDRMCGSKRLTLPASIALLWGVPGGFPSQRATNFLELRNLILSAVPLSVWLPKIPPLRVSSFQPGHKCKPMLRLSTTTPNILDRRIRYSLCQKGTL